MAKIIKVTYCNEQFWKAVDEGRILKIVNKFDKILQAGRGVEDYAGSGISLGGISEDLTRG